MERIDRLFEQRDAVVMGTWVQRTPNPATNEACLIARSGTTPSYQQAQWKALGEPISAAILRRDPIGWLLAVIHTAHFRDKITLADCPCICATWNDVRGRKWEDVVAVIDDAIRAEKDRCSEPSSSS